MPTWAAMLLLGVGAILAFRGVGFVFRRSLVRMCVMLCMTMGCLAVVFLLASPGRRSTSVVVQMPPIPSVPTIDGIFATSRPGHVAVQQYLEAARVRGAQVAEIARIRMESGAERLALAAREMGSRAEGAVNPAIELFTQRHGPVAVTVPVQLGKWRVRPHGVLSSGLIAFAIGALLYLGYLLLDASTRGHFTWALRGASVLTFAAMCAALFILHHGL